MAETASARLDKWLWHARVVRTRTLAKKLVEAGKVRVNRAKTHSPSQAVRVGDVLTIVLPGAVRVYEIAGLAERRGPFSEACQLYVDRTQTPTDREEGGEPGAGDAGQAVGQMARPDGRQRRAARLLRGKPG